jgi:hypothetical protein
MARTNTGKRVRFDVRSRVFLGIAAEYRDALNLAERLWRRLSRNHIQRDARRKDKTLRELSDVEQRLDRARAALFEHTRKIAVDPLRVGAKSLDLVDRDEKGAA